jgi:hypothetical protein
MFKNKKIIKLMLISELASVVVSFLAIYFLGGRNLRYSIIFTTILNIILGIINYNSIRTSFGKDIR